MKKIQYILINGLLFSAIAVQAQTAAEADIIKRDVTIEKAYEPTIMSAGKENDLPPIADPDLKKVEADYSDYSTTLTPPYEVRQLEQARAKMPSTSERKEGYLRLGGGNYWATLGDFMYPLLRKASKDRLDISLHHKGVFASRKHHKSDIGLAYRHYFDAGELILDFDYGIEGFNYYGIHKLSDDTLYRFADTTFLGKDYFKKNAQISTWNFTAGYQSFPFKDKIQHFTFLFNYRGFSPNYGLKEHVFNTDIKYDRKLHENKFGVNLRMENLLYNADRSLYDGQKNYTVVRFTPYFDFLQERWNLHIGAKLNFAGAGRVFAPAADISTQITLAEKILYFYGGITGDLQTNTQNELLDLNRYIDLNRKIKDTYTPFDVYGGFKFKLIYNFLTDVSVSYKTIKDMYFFASNTVVEANNSNSKNFANVFGVRYSDANLFTASLKFDYNLNHKFGFLLAGKYNGWKVKNEQAAWQLPQFEFDAGIDVKIAKRFSANLYAYAATGRKAIVNTDERAETMKGIFDLNLGFFYTHSSRLSAFLKLNNLLNRSHDQWYGYRVNGFNALIGLAFAF